MIIRSPDGAARSVRAIDQHEGRGSTKAEMKKRKTAIPASLSMPLLYAAFLFLNSHVAKIGSVAYFALISVHGPRSPGVAIDINE